MTRRTWLSRAFIGLRPRDQSIAPAYNTTSIRSAPPSIKRWKRVIPDDKKGAGEILYRLIASEDDDDNL